MNYMNIYIYIYCIIYNMHFVYIHDFIWQSRLSYFHSWNKRSDPTSLETVRSDQLQKEYLHDLIFVVVGWSPCCFSLPRCLLDMNPSSEWYVPRIWWTPRLKAFMNLLWGMRHFWTWILSGAWVAWVAFVANGSKPLGLRIIKHPVPTSRLVSCGGGSLHFQTQPETTETVWIISSFCLSKFMSQILRP